MPNTISPQQLNPNYLINDDYRKLVFNEVNDTSLMWLPKKYCITYSNDPNYIYFRLEVRRTGEHLSLVRLRLEVVNLQEYYKVDKSHSFIKRKGYAVPLYEYCFLYLDHPVISDYTQTMPGSSNLWKKMYRRRKNKNYEILVLNTKTNQLKLYTKRNYKDYDIWGWDQYLIDFTKTDDTLIDLMYHNKELSDLQFGYLKLWIKKLKDREHILLVGRQK